MSNNSPAYIVVWKCPKGHYQENTHYYGSDVIVNGQVFFPDRQKDARIKIQEAVNLVKEQECL